MIKYMDEFERLTTKYLNDTRVERVAAKTVVKHLVSHTGQAQSDLVRLLDNMMRHPAGSDGWARRAWYGIFWYVQTRAVCFLSELSRVPFVLRQQRFCSWMTPETDPSGKITDIVEEALGRAAYQGEATRR